MTRLPLLFATLLATMPLAGCIDMRPDAYAPPAAPVAADPATVAGFAARGNEPFWRVVTAGGTGSGATITLSTPQVPAGVTLPATRTPTASGVSYSAALSGRPVSLSITRGPCTDDMSGARFEFAAALTVNDATHSGCAARN